MNTRFLATLAGAFGVGMLILSVSAAEPQATESTPAGDGIFNQEAVIRATDDTAAQAGVQPQGRGPVHEAFAEATTDQPKPGPVVPKKPPEAIEEMPPAEKPEGDDVQWISGYWAYDDERSDFIWVTGIWRAIPPGRQWVPGHWTQVEGGYQWVAGFWTAADGGEVAVVPAPPDPEPETPPAAPSADSTFVPGTQVYQKETNKFVWQPGYYVTYRPGWVWVPAHYIWTPCGYIFVDGYWDYDVQDRGLLFAPVVIDAQYVAQADWVYTPSYVVHDVCLLDSLFVRRDCGCYFFGDYFDAGYADLGYVSWADYRFGRLGYDPLFGYYRWLHRNDSHWEKDLRGLFAARSKGQAVRPPHNLFQQQALGKKFLAGNRLAAGTLQNSVMLGPVNKLDHKVVKVQTLDKSGQLKYRKTADQFRTVSRSREQVENKLVAQGITAGRKTGSQTLQLNLAKPTGGIKLNAGKTPPPPPVKRLDGTTGNGNRTDVKLGQVPGGQGGLKVNGNAGNTGGNQGGVKTNTIGNANGNIGGKTNTNGPAPVKINTTPGNTTTGSNGAKVDGKTDAKVGNGTGTQGEVKNNTTGNSNGNIGGKTNTNGLPPVKINTPGSNGVKVDGKTDAKVGNVTGTQGEVKTNTTGNANGNVGGKTNTNGQSPLKLNTLPGTTTPGSNGGKTDVKTDTKVGNVTGTQGGKVTLPGGSNPPPKPAGGPNLNLQSLPGGQGASNSGFKSERIERNTGTVNVPSQGNGLGRIGSTNFESVTTRIQPNPTPARLLPDGGVSFNRTNSFTQSRPVQTFTQRTQPVQTFTQRTQPVQTFQSSTPRFSSGSSGFSGGSSGFSGSSFRASPGGGRRR